MTGHFARRLSGFRARDDPAPQGKLPIMHAGRGTAQQRAEQSGAPRGAQPRDPEVHGPP